MSKGEAILDATTYPPTIIAALVDIARATWEMVDNSEERDGGEIIVDEADFERLSKALDVIERLPEPPGEVSTGPRKAEYWIAQWHPRYE